MKLVETVWKTLRSRTLKLKRIFTVSENIPEHTINSVIRYRQSALRLHRLVKEKRKLHSNNCKQTIKNTVRKRLSLAQVISML